MNAGGDGEARLSRYDTDFGSKLRECRKAAGMRQRGLAVVLGWSTSKVSMIERGERQADERFAEEADEALKAGGVLLVAWREAARNTARTPDWFIRWVEIEQQAVQLRTWEPLIVPGLLQTEEYARAIFRGKPGTTPEDVEQSVRTRMERQRFLGAVDGPTMWAVLDEGVLTRPIGSKAVMAEQMAYLDALNEHPRVSVRILPRYSWLTTGLQGAFILANGRGMPDTAYIESITLNQITADPARVLEVKSRYEMLHGDALPRQASRDLIKEMAKQWTTT
jgi:transcriptional regulator with XRE-family HTH domain